MEIDFGKKEQVDALIERLADLAEERQKVLPDETHDYGVEQVVMASKEVSTIRRSEVEALVSSKLLVRKIEKLKAEAPPSPPASSSEPIPIDKPVRKKRTTSPKKARKRRRGARREESIDDYRDDLHYADKAELRHQILTQNLPLEHSPPRTA